MKILFVIDTYQTNNNGTSISAQRFAAELRKRGHQVRILTTGEPSEDIYALDVFRIPVFQGLIEKTRIPVCFPRGRRGDRSCPMGRRGALLYALRVRVLCQKDGRPTQNKRAARKLPFQVWKMRNYSIFLYSLTISLMLAGARRP